MAEDFAVNRGEFSQASISRNAPIKGSCTMILHGRSMRPLQNLTDGFNNEWRQKSRQDPFNGCACRF